MLVFSFEAKITLMFLSLTLLVTQTSSIRLEAESALLHGPHVANDRTGYSGSGYVTGFEKDGDRIIFHFQAKAGIYVAHIHFCTPSGEKGSELKVNGASYSLMFPSRNSFSELDAGLVELKSGDNTLSIEKGWGWFEVDSVTLKPAAVSSKLKPLRAKLSDTQASIEAKNLYSTLLRSYGSKAFSGQYDKKDCDYVRAIAGVTPAILGDDLMDYSPTRVGHGSMPKDTTERLIQAAKAGQIVTLSWHWNAPSHLFDREITDAQGNKVDARWYKGFMAYASSFDLAKALANPQSDDYKLLLSDIDAIAVQLKKLQTAKVPVLWRPLHEADGGWFWWGSKGAESFKKLWRLLHSRLTKANGIHNLIWVNSSGTKPEWYPGDDVVDVVGVDAYPSDPSDPLSNTWATLLQQFDGKKPIALTEFGGVPDIQRMQRFGVRWAYFVSWTGSLGAKKLSPADLKRCYTQKSVINR